ncbi:hypothetical protein H0H93_001223 [Arthromyces matolae]|nr:hypothetical protein H0H93_001223 [Arthromyces matolae]
MITSTILPVVRIQVALSSKKLMPLPKCDDFDNPSLVWEFTVNRSSSALETSQVRPLPPKPVTLQQVIQDEEIKVQNTGTSRDTWSSHGLPEPPQIRDEGFIRAPSPLRRPVSENTIPPTSSEMTMSTSSSMKRWEQLRQHVLIPSRSSTPVPAPPPPQSIPARSQTPVQKSSRLARLGFRHVVEHAREADEARRLSQEFEKICWSIRMAELPRIKVDSAASSLHLGFISNTSLASTGSSPGDPSSNFHKKHELRRPQSIQSLSSSNRSISSVKPLYQLILLHTTPSADKRVTFVNLPHESLVLSALLAPFLLMEQNVHLDEERWNALEAFEMINRTWPPHNESAGVERYLWCCKAASVPHSSMRTRILSILWGLIIPIDTRYPVSTPECFRTLAHGLFSLLPHLRPLANTPAAHEEVPFLSGVIEKVRDGCCGEIEPRSLQEEYDATFSGKDDKNLVREALLLEALSRCLEDCTNNSRIWLFQNVIEQYWTKEPQEIQFTPLLSSIYARALDGLSRALLSIILIPQDQTATVQTAHRAAQIIQARLNPFLDALDKAVRPEAMMNVVNAVWELICMEKDKEVSRWALSLVHSWYRGLSIWKSSLDSTLQDFISKGAWSKVIPKLTTLVRLLPDEVRKPAVIFLLPSLYDRLVEAPPPYPCAPLTNLLDIIAHLYPQVFYKPLFLCAASSKEFTVVNHLCIICIVSKFLPDFWIRDAEMVSIALMSDGGKKVPEADRKTWAKPRLGQAVVMLELIAFIQSARHEKEKTSTSSDGFLANTVKFVAALEVRLAILLEARVSHFHPIVSSVFLKLADWLVRIVDWYIDIHTDDGTGSNPEEEETSTIGQIRGLYAAAQDGIRSTAQRRSTMFLSQTLQKSPSNDNDGSGGTNELVNMFTQREPLMSSIAKGFVGKAMKLLVAMSTQITNAEYRRLGPHIWDLLQDEGDASLTAAVCFLIMQCAEKTPLDLVAIIEVDLQSSDVTTKLKAVRKIAILFNWRYQIISQHVIADRARRPFKSARGPLPFVSTDIGSSAYIREDDPDDMTDNLPAELRKRLAEIGWTPDDAPIDKYREWIKVPLSLLSSQQLDRLESVGPDIAPPASPMLNLGSLSTLTAEKIDETGLLRRNSSTGGPIGGMKRRAVFVPSLALIFPRLASLVFDPNLAISSAARSTILDIMRNDPTLISRPVLDLFAGEQKDIQSAVVTLNAFLHVQGVLPYPTSHFLFNHVAGFLKWATRQSEDTDALQDFAYSLPVVARLSAQVSGLSIKDIRRAKIESLLIPSGSLWFPPSAPIGPMFPRSLGSSNNPFDLLPSDLVSMTIIRAAQNMLLLSMLKRNQNDVQLVRKSMSRLELPTTTPIDSSPLDLPDFVPRKTKPEQVTPSLTGLSLALARSHVLLVAQVFRSMSRHLNDRNELAALIEGLNRVLLVHGDDIGVVSQVIIALMVAGTRFRRLFTSGGGYALFMPILLKVYTEAQSHDGIRLAIEYGVNRFYALHKDSFVFQTLDILAQVTALPHIDAEPLVKSIYNLLLALRKGVSPLTPDAAGIHNANKVQEREALIMSTAEEKPQTFLALLRRNQTIGESQHLVAEMPEEYDAGRLSLEDFVRLLLTVIAHDFSIIRAEQFLRLLRFFTPHLYHASSTARSVLQEGLGALAILLLKGSVKLKNSEAIGESTHPSSQKIIENLEKSRSASNIMTMRLDYLALVTSYIRAGGLLSSVVMLRTTELLRTMLKEVPLDINHGISKFIPEFIRGSFLRQNPPPLKVAVAFLEELAALISNYGPVVDFSGTFQSISELAAIPAYANEPHFARAVVSRICAPALSSCEAAAAENILMTLPSRMSIVALIAQSVFLRGADVISEVQKRAPSYDYLAGVVLPLVLSLKTGAILDQDAQTETWHRDAAASAWVRLLSFAMSVCNQREPLERSRSHNRRRSSDLKKSSLLPILIALQIIKVILVRAEIELSSRVPGVWPRMNSFLISILSEGNAGFATTANISPLPSPTHSPRSSIHLDPFQTSTSTSFPSELSLRSLSHPRMMDYSLWSFLEIVCVHQSPLVLQMRQFMVEKLVELDREFRQLHNDPRRRRVSSSAFSKPRRHVSGILSPSTSGSSPFSATLQSASPSTPHGLMSLEAGRQPGYNVASSPHSIPGPKIVHLGPTSPFSAFGRSLSPGRGGSIDNGKNTAKIKSVALALATYKRIRTVQSFMGYTLLPMPEGQDIDGDDVYLTRWTEKEILHAIQKETEELLQEFEDFDLSLVDERVLVDVPQPSS